MGAPTHITTDHVHPHFDGTLPPVAVVDQDECFTLQTVSLPTGPSELPPHVVDALLVPVTGPVAVRGLLQGDVVRIEVLSISIASEGAIVTMPGYGAFVPPLRPSYRVVPILDDVVHFDESIRLPIQPMVGKLGVGVSEGPPNSSTVGRHGGNMDNRTLGAGAIIYLPVFVKGALVFAGDLHARQGDGEVCLSAVEVAGDITLRCRKARSFRAATPVVTAEGMVSTLGDGRSLDAATEMALTAMLELVERAHNWPREKAAMFLSIAGNVGVCQLVNPRVGAKVSVPLEYFPTSFFE
jgi:amidase